MTRSDLNKRIKDLNENNAFQLVGRFAAFFAAVVLGPLTVWAIVLLIGINNDVGILKTKVENALTDPYKGADAKRDLALRDNMIGNNGAKIADVDGRLKTIEYASARRRPQP